MTSPERVRGGRACGAPFPVHDDLVGSLLEAHASEESLRDLL